MEIKRKISVRGKCLRLSAEIADQIFDDPSADYGVVRNDQDRDNGIDPAAKREPFGFSKTLVSAYRALFGHSSQRCLSHDHGVAEGKSQDDVDQ